MLSRVALIAFALLVTAAAHAEITTGVTKSCTGEDMATCIGPKPAGTPILTTPLVSSTANGPSYTFGKPYFLPQQPDVIVEHEPEPPPVAVKPVPQPHYCVSRSRTIRC